MTPKKVIFVSYPLGDRVRASKMNTRTPRLGVIS